MSILTQGTQVYALAPIDGSPLQFEVLEVDCPTAFDPGTDSADEIEDTCLSETEARTYKPGLTTPAEATLTINADPTVASHVRLYELYIENPKPSLRWAIGWSDGFDIAPTVTAGDDDFTLPAGRTWFVFDGYISAFPFSFEQNSVVSSEITIRRSGAARWIPKEAP